MVLTSVVFIILVSLCGVRDVHADTNLAAFSRKLNMLDRTTQAWKGTVADLGTEMNNNFDLLKEELTSTFIPALIKPLVKQAITGILKEEYMGNIISGRVLAVVNSLKTRVHNTKTQLRSVKRKIRQVKRERDSYKKSLGKLRGELTKDIHRDLQGIQQRIRELEERDALREKPIQDLTEQNQKASIDQSRDRSNREKAAQMTTVTTHASSDPSQTERTPVVTTKKPATQASIDQSRDRSNREKAAQMTTVTTHASSDPSQTERTPVVTTKKPATQASIDQSRDRSNREKAAQMTTVTTHASSDPSRTEGTPVATTKKPAAQASIDQSRDRSNREKAAQMTTVTTHASSDPSRTEGTPVATTKKPAAQASIDQSRDRSNREKAAQMTTVTTHASSDPSRTEGTPVATTKKPAAQATPSPADCSRLIDASWRGELEEVKRLLFLGVDVNCRGWRNWTPLMWAAGYGNSDVVELLVSKGADASLVDVVGVNILHFAGWGGDLETVKFVLSLNVVDIDARDKEGKTAADYARSNRYPRVVDLLESRGAQ